MAGSLPDSFRWKQSAAAISGSGTSTIRFPEFFIRSYQLRGLRTATPRLNFEGPIIPGKLFFSQGVEYQLRKTPIYTLPFPDNLEKQEGVNTFAQLDWIVSGTQLVTATVHVAPQRLQYVNMDFFNPQATTPDATTHNYTATVADRLTIGGGLLENTLSATQFDARIWGQGNEDLTLAPDRNSGNYFAQQNRRAERIGLTSTFSLPPLNLFGAHHVKVGSYVAESADHGQAVEHPVNILDSYGQLIERMTFTGRPALPGLRHGIRGLGTGPLDRCPSARLRPGPPYRIAAGVRSASSGPPRRNRLDSVQEFQNRGSRRCRTLLRPRPSERLLFRPVSRSDRHALRRPGQHHIRARISIEMPSAKSAPARPSSSRNRNRETSPRAAPLGARRWNNKSSPNLKLRIGYMQTRSDGLIIMNRTAPDPATGLGTNLLSSGGQSRYRQFETTAKIRLKNDGQLFLSYVRSKARGDLNDFSTSSAVFPRPIIRPNQFSNLPTDLPNRFLAWGMIQLPVRVPHLPGRRV